MLIKQIVFVKRKMYHNTYMHHMQQCGKKAKHTFAEPEATSSKIFSLLYSSNKKFYWCQSVLNKPQGTWSVYLSGYIHLLRRPQTWAHLVGGKLWWCGAAAEVSWEQHHSQRWGHPRWGTRRNGLKGWDLVLWVEPPCSLWHSLWCPCPLLRSAGKQRVWETVQSSLVKRTKGITFIELTVCCGPGPLLLILWLRYYGSCSTTLFFFLHFTNKIQKNNNNLICNTVQLSIENNEKRKKKPHCSLQAHLSNITHHFESVITVSQPPPLLGLCISYTSYKSFR